MTSLRISFHAEFFPDPRYWTFDCLVGRIAGRPGAALFLGFVAVGFYVTKTP